MNNDLISRQAAIEAAKDCTGRENAVFCPDKSAKG